jgi:hypothetical protein
MKNALLLAIGLGLAMVSCAAYADMAKVTIDLLPRIAELAMNNNAASTAGQILVVLMILMATAMAVNEEFIKPARRGIRRLRARFSR